MCKLVKTQMKPEFRNSGIQEFRKNHENHLSDTFASHLLQPNCQHQYVPPGSSEVKWGPTCDRDLPWTCMRRQRSSRRASPGSILTHGPTAVPTIFFTSPVNLFSLSGALRTPANIPHTNWISISSPVNWAGGGASWVDRQGRFYRMESQRYQMRREKIVWQFLLRVNLNLEKKRGNIFNLTKK